MPQAERNRGVNPMKQKQPPTIPMRCCADFAEQLSAIKGDSLADSLLVAGEVAIENIKAANVQFSERLAEDKTVQKFTISLGCTLFSLRRWQRTKQVFRFDESLYELLCEQQSAELKIDKRVFETLPMDSFFIEQPNDTGFFCTVVQSERRKGLRLNDSLIITMITSDYKGASIFIDLVKSQTVEDALAASVGEYATKEGAAELSKMLQLVIYLAATNAEIHAVTNTAYDSDKPKQARSAPAKVVNRPAVSEVGYRFGTAYREHRERKATETGHANASTGSSTPKAPHIRRSHFHSYWVGSGEEKHIEVRWINAIFVNADEDIVPTVHKVEK